MAPESARPLLNQTVLVTRPEAVAQPLIQCLTEAGAQVVHWPALDITPMDPAEASGARSQLLQSQYLIFSSQPAVLSALAILESHPIPATTEIFAVGATTASRLQEAGYAVTYPTDGNGSEALLAMAELSRVEGIQVGIVCAPGGRQLLVEELTERGAEVNTVETYRTAPAEISPATLATLDKTLNDLWLTATSGQILLCLSRVLAPQLQGDLFRCPILVPAQRLYEYATELGFRQVLVSSGPQPAAMLSSLMAYKATQNTPD